MKRESGLDVVEVFRPWSSTLREALQIVDQINQIAAHRRMFSSASVANIIEAVVAAEDHRFWRHPGVDCIAILRVLWRYVTRGELSGGSTIEQQLVRTIRKRYEVSLRRKLSEIAIAMVVARRISKEEIIKAYLDVAYFGWRATGIAEAARRFDIDVGATSKREAATLAALLKLPMPRFPSTAYRCRLAEREAYVLGRMSRNGGPS
jgi:penicillin-binding protein 1A